MENLYTTFVLQKGAMRIITNHLFIKLQAPKFYNEVDYKTTNYV